MGRHPTATPALLRATPALLRAFATLVAGALVASGCAALAPIDLPAWSFFQAPDAGDAWTPQITSWQRRERALPSTEQLRPEVARAEDSVSEAGLAQGAPGPDTMTPVLQADGSARVEPTAASPGSVLRQDWFAFRAEQKRLLAQNAADWIQRAARGHYLPDGPIDHWATLEETLARNGDDCDGLELLTYHFLLDLGFRQDEVYRAIVHHPADGQHHMVTFWFEDAADPWVIDPTGAMTSGMPRLSQVPGWVPLKVFSESAEYSVRPAERPAAAVGLRASH